MPSYLFSTSGLRTLVEHCADPAIQFDDVQLIVCELNPITCNPELGSLLALKSESDLHERREDVHDFWIKDQQTLGGHGVNGAVHLLSQCFSHLNTAGKAITLTVVGCTQGWHHAADDDHVHGSQRLLRELENLDAYLDKKAFRDGDSANLMLKILEASHNVSAPITSLNLNLRNSSHNFDKFPTGALQKMSYHSGTSLPVLEHFALTLKVSASVNGLDDVSEASSVTLVEELSDCGTEISDDASSTFEAFGLENMLEVLANGASQLALFGLTICGPASDGDFYSSILDSTNKALSNAYFQEIALHRGRFASFGLQNFLQSHAIGLKTLILDNVQLGGADSWRTELAWMAENLTLDALELNNLRSKKTCTKSGRQRTRVLCGLCDGGAWASYGYFDGAEKVAEGLEYLVDKKTGQYQWLDSLVDGRTKALLDDEVNGGE